jgi:RecB family exonuclease
MILDLAYESAGKDRPYGGTLDLRSHGAFRFENLLRDGRWVEVPIEVPELRLKGRIDVLDRRGKEAKITDIKSGYVEDENGEIVERVVRQIRLYGLMTNWFEPSTHVILTILAGVERPVPFEADVRGETLGCFGRERTRSLQVAQCPATASPR